MKSIARVRGGTAVGLLAALLASGCISAVRVHSGENGEDYEQGIPFYIKVGRFKQTTTYHQSWLLVTLSLQEKAAYVENNKVKFQSLPPVTLSKRLLAEGMEPVVALQKYLALNTAGEVDDSDVPEGTPQVPAVDARTFVKHVVNTFSKIEGISLEILTAMEGKLAGNQTEQVTVVDYSNPHYINAPLPWFGSGSVATEFNADGTLTKAEASAEQDLSKLSTLIPIQDYLKYKWIPGAGAEILDVTPRSFVEVSLSIETKGYEYKFTRVTTDKPTADGSLPPIGWNLNGNYTRTPLGAKAPAKKDTRKTVDFSGNVKLPK